MWMFGRRKQALPAPDVTLELSPLSATAEHTSTSLGKQSSSLKDSDGGDCGANSESSLLPERRLLHLAEVYEQTRAAQRAQGPRAVAPALEPYVGATHFRAGSLGALPGDISSAVSIGSPARAYNSNGFVALVFVFATLFYGGYGAILCGAVAFSNDCGATATSLRGLFYAAAPVLIALPLLAAAALAVFDKDPLVLVPTPFACHQPKKTLVDALYFLYCEDKCGQLQGRRDELVHKVKLGRNIHSVHGDGHVSLHTLPPPKRS